MLTKNSYLLFNERILVVCSPAFLEKHPECEDLENIWQQPLMVLRDAPEFWESWQSWASRQGIDYQPAQNVLQMEDQIAITQAALNDAGIALAWDWHVQPFIENGELIALSDPIECDNNAFFLSHSEQSTRRSAVRFIHWVIEQVAQHPPRVHSHHPQPHLKKPQL